MSEVLIVFFLMLFAYAVGALTPLWGLRGAWRLLKRRVALMLLWSNDLKYTLWHAQRICKHSDDEDAQDIALRIQEQLEDLHLDTQYDKEEIEHWYFSQEND